MAKVKSNGKNELKCLRRKVREYRRALAQIAKKAASIRRDLAKVIAGI